MSENWSDILSREWYNCPDKEYAKRIRKAVKGDLESFDWLFGNRAKETLRPSAIEVETALHQACQEWPKARDVWERRLDRLDRAKDKLAPVGQLIKALQHTHWLERFIAQHCLVCWGGQAVEALYPFAVREADPLQQTALWLLASIGHNTASRFAERQDILCPKCLTYFQPNQIDLPHQPNLTFYGCRACNQSREFLEGIRYVIAILNTAWTEIQLQRNDTLHINWLVRRALFDFDRVEIIQAPDEEVERFAVQVGNDTDPVREPRYKQMKCYVAPECWLSENTLRILVSMFGEVVPYAPHL